MALPLLTSQIGEQGALVIDFGAGTTEYAVYLDGSLSHSGVYAIGGDHVTNDLAVGLKLTQSKAERLKLDHGRAVFDPRQANRTVNFSSDVGFDDKQISVGHLYQIMNARLIELFELIRTDLERNELIRRINGGILLCGGGARIPQIDILAREVLGLDVLNNNEPDGLVSQSFAIQPEFVTAMGLVRYGARKIKTENSKKPGLIGWLVGN
jgi:cell division protein FtsA